MFDLIKPQEQDMIVDYIQNFGPIESEYCNYKMADLKTILHQWEINKTQLFKLFNNNLILKRPYTYSSTSDNLAKEIDNKKNADAYKLFEKWWNREIIASFAYIPQYDDLSELCYDVMSSLTLAENKYLGDTHIFTFPDGETFKVSKGMRPIKIITKIAQKYNCPEEKLENFRIWHSQMLNTKNIDGELCLSIHPLDFMTMSDNSNNWESCMNWIHKGDYRSGTIECLNSPYIVIAYLHNPEHPMRLSIGDNWEWNSKRWRELFLINEKIITEIKGYCFQDEHLTNTILMWLKELADNNLNWTYDNDEINMNSTIPWEDGDMCFRFYTECYMYNDFGQLDIHRGRINRKKLGKYKHITEWQSTNEQTWHYMAEFPYGGTPTCMWCGKPIEAENRDNAVMCLKCDGGTYCACCGTYMANDTGCYIDDLADPICEYCFDYECEYDSLTGERHLSSNLTFIKLCLAIEDGIPVEYANNSIAVFDPDYNIDYQKIFKVAPHYYKRIYGGTYYVLKEDVNDIEILKDLFMLDQDEINLLFKSQG